MQILALNLEPRTDWLNSEAFRRINHNQGSRKGKYIYFFNAISSPNPMLDHLLESSHRDDSNQ